MLTQEDILEFQQIYAEEFGETITYEQAHGRAIEIATYFEMLSESAHDKRLARRRGRRSDPSTPQTLPN